MLIQVNKTKIETSIKSKLNIIVYNVHFRKEVSQSSTIENGFSMIYKEIFIYNFKMFIKKKKEKKVTIDISLIMRGGDIPVH